MTTHNAHACDSTNIPVVTLPRAERFVVWVARTWIDAHCAGRFPCPRLQAMFQHMHLQDCIGPFYSLFTFLATDATRDLDFRCPGCRSLGDDERRLLTLLAAYQQGAARAADVILQDWLPERLMERAVYPARLIANGLADAGLRLRGAAAPPLYALPLPSTAH